MLGIGMIVILVASELLGWITLPWGVVGHEGSTLLVTLNGLRLLRQVRVDAARQEPRLHGATIRDQPSI